MHLPVLILKEHLEQCPLLLLLLLFLGWFIDAGSEPIVSDARILVSSVCTAVEGAF